jgi:hypothetical protein
LERLLPRHVQFAGGDEQSRRGEQELALVDAHLVRLAVVDVQPPDASVLDPLAPVDIDVEGHLGREVILLRHRLQVLEQFLSGRQGPAPVWVQLIGVAVQHARHITGAAYMVAGRQLFTFWFVLYEIGIGAYRDIG